MSKLECIYCERELETEAYKFNNYYFCCDKDCLVDFLVDTAVVDYVHVKDELESESDE